MGSGLYLCFELTIFMQKIKKNALIDLLIMTFQLGLVKILSCKDLWIIDIF